MKADRIKLERLMNERATLLERLNKLDLEITVEQSQCSCPDLVVKPNGEKVCPDCFYSWSADY